MRPLHAFLAVVALVASSAPADAAPAPFALGANFNENMHAARLPALDATGVKWIRGFLPATEFIDGPRRLATDPALATFLRRQSPASTPQTSP